MDLGKNQLSGTLPVQWQSLTALTRLDLSNNTFMSTIPSAWQSGTPYMSQLRSLLLSGNSAM
jgi:Leucine-rich repeat (LRR) protein